MAAFASRSLVLPASVAFVGGVATGLFVARARIHRLRARLADEARRAWSLAECDLLADLSHIPRGQS